MQMTLRFLSHRTTCNHQWLEPAVAFGFNLLHVLYWNMT